MSLGSPRANLETAHDVNGLDRRGFPEHPLIAATDDGGSARPAPDDRPKTRVESLACLSYAEAGGV
jgi:hypothetical protein